VTVGFVDRHLHPRIAGCRVDRLVTVVESLAVLALQEQMKAAGAWPFGGRLTDADLATVVRATEREALTTDGPYVESK
jgi:hypothetical protein